MSDDRGRPQYSRDEVEEILRRAAERTHEAGGEALTHDELVAAAREAGIDTSAVEEAASSLAETRLDRLAVERWTAARRRRLVSHALTWIVVNAGLFLIDLLSGGGWWFYWPLLAWGIAVALQAVGALREPTPDQVERVARRDRRKREAERKRQARRAEREARRRRVAAQGDQLRNKPRDLERALESGVSTLLASLARRIDVATRPPAGPLADTEFNRYVTHKKGGATTPRQIVTPAPRTEGPGGPRVRVDARRVDDDDREHGDEEIEKRPVPPQRARR